ncbi:MAG: hypothetical protein N2489_08665 [Clostridia bacterium]|nr:hypothetical protein [Clostridia bacterium]
MRQSPELQRIQENMKPGYFSSEGFLGEDARNLADILQQDQAVVDMLGISHTEIAERMRSLTEKGMEGLGKPVLVDDIFEVIVEDYMGSIPCPFSDKWHSEKRNTTVKNLLTNLVITWTDLNIHMIEAHGFYEGIGSKFRVSPDEICEILMLSTKK